MLDKENEPSEREINRFIGQKYSYWLELHKFLEENYEFTPEKVFYGMKYGWTVRYRKSGRTLCSLFPEEDAFTVLIVLGKKEVEKTILTIDKLNPEVKSVFENAKQLRDGRWLWVRIFSSSDIESIKELVKIKRKPKQN